MKHSTFTWCYGSDTIRLMPQNYIIATRQGDTRWTADIDHAISDFHAARIFLRIRKNTYSTAVELVEKLNTNLT